MKKCFCLICLTRLTKNKVTVLFLYWTSGTISSTTIYFQMTIKNFLKFLRDLLKDKPYVERAYMTDVLPIAKYSSSPTIYV